MTAMKLACVGLLAGILAGLLLLSGCKSNTETKTVDKSVNQVMENLTAYKPDTDWVSEDAETGSVVYKAYRDGWEGSLTITEYGEAMVDGFYAGACESARQSLEQKGFGDCLTSGGPDSEYATYLYTHTGVGVWYISHFDGFLVEVRIFADSDFDVMALADELLLGAGLNRVGQSGFKQP